MPDREIEGSFGRLEDGVLRVNRSTDGHGVLWYHPDWRSRQVQLYLNAASETDGPGPFSLPRWEDDPAVINLYVFRRRGRCDRRRWTSLISLSVQCDEWNDHHGLGSRVKAYAVAGRSDDEIGDALDMDPEVVGTYLDLFYDIRPIAHLRQRMASVVFPFSPDVARRHSLAEQREQLWVAAAFSGGDELLEFFTTNRFDMSRAEIESSLEMIISMMTAQSLEYGVYLRSEGIPRPTHFDKFIAVQDIFTKHMGVKATLEHLERESSRTDRDERWKELISGVGIRATEARVISSNGGGVSGLSIADLRSGADGGGAGGGGGDAGGGGGRVEPPEGLSLTTYRGEE